MTAAALHDYEHPGVNNLFLIRLQDPIAIRYSDISVLENHHIAASFELMLGNSQNNWAYQFEQADFLRVRQLMIDCVLATDMSHHFKELNELKQRVAQEDFAPAKGKDKLAVIKFAFHLADISNPIKAWDLCKEWTDLLYVEFFSQGDLERQHSFPITQLCDRSVTNVAKSQIGFIDFIIKPSYQVLVNLCPSLQSLMTSIERNRSSWMGEFDSYEERMIEGNNYMIESIESRNLPGASNITKARRILAQKT